ncbi:MAG: MFS transporter [Thermodesulfobacteriota bacterium]
MIETSQPPKLFFIFSILSALFTLSMFYRVSSAVIAPNLMHDLGLNAENLGILGGAFFYSFALLQIPMGPMLDRMGPRIVITSFSMIGALGAFVFACGNSFPVVLLGRILIGVGMASALMGSMKIFLLRFPPEKFVTLIGLFQAVGTFGNIFAASPLAFLTSTVGWRMTFVIAGVVTALLALLTFLILGEKKGDSEGLASSPSSQPEIGILQSFRLILGSLTFWQIGAAAFFRYGTFVSLQGLWLGPYLIDIRGHSPVQTGNLIILLAIGIIVGGPVAGWLSDRTFHSRKGVALGGLSLYCLSLLPLTGVVKVPSPFWFGLIFFFIGFFSSFGMVIYAHAKELFPIAISGTVMAGVNFFTMAGPALFMPTLGKIIESFHHEGRSYPAEAYHFSFLVCFLGMAVSLVFYAFSKKEEIGT